MPIKEPGGALGAAGIAIEPAHQSMEQLVIVRGELAHPRNRNPGPSDIDVGQPHQLCGRIHGASLIARFRRRQPVNAAIKATFRRYHGELVGDNPRFFADFLARSGD
jgi:hypothetical protein